MDFIEAKLELPLNGGHVFATVAHEEVVGGGIMRDLYDLGIRGRLPIFVASFLSDRRFRVRIGTVLSGPHDQELGVPQGSVLSVTLFSLKINSVANSIPRGVTCSMYVDGEEVKYKISDIQTSKDEVMKLCKDINIYKASSIEYLSSRILKDAFLAIPTIITKLMNLSLSQGIFPDSWKMAKIVPLFKGGEKIDVNNYRPVSLLPLPGKLLEKIVHSRIMAFLDSHGILNDNQDGFRPDTPQSVL